MFQAPNEAIESAVKMQPTPLHLATRRSWTGLLDTITNTPYLQPFGRCFQLRLDGTPESRCAGRTGEAAVITGEGTQSASTTPDHLYIPKSSRMNIGLASAFSLVCCAALATGAPSLALFLASNLPIPPSRPSSYQDASCFDHGFVSSLSSLHTGRATSALPHVKQSKHVPSTAPCSQLHRCKIGVPCLENLPPIMRPLATRSAPAELPLSIPSKSVSQRRTAREEPSLSRVPIRSLR